jgi:hypothetical protein
MNAAEILKKRRDRAIAIVLSVKEREIDPLLKQVQGGERAAKAMRKVVLDQFNDFFDMALDVAMSGESATFEFNADIWLKRFDELEELIISAGATPSSERVDSTAVGVT